MINGIIDITDNEFKSITKLVYNRFGVNLTDKKRELVKGRLNKLIKNLGFTSFSEYQDHILKDKTSNSLLDLIDKISTNHTYFFREADHFDYLKETVLPELIKKKTDQKNKEIKIWCAGCATGEEPYTLAAVILNYFGIDIVGWKISMLATDISVSALEQAMNGEYEKKKADNVPKEYMGKMFERTTGDIIKVKENLKKMVLFKRLNFMREHFPFKGKFDVIFCRNVMIYFDSPTRQSLIKKQHKFLNDDGHLFIGHSESILKETVLFKYIRPAIYRKVNVNEAK